MCCGPVRDPRHHIGRMLRAIHHGKHSPASGCWEKEMCLTTWRWMAASFTLSPLDGGGGEGTAVKNYGGLLGFLYLLFHFCRIYIFMNLELLLHRMRER